MEVEGGPQTSVTSDEAGNPGPTLKTSKPEDGKPTTSTEVLTSPGRPVSVITIAPHSQPQDFATKSRESSPKMSASDVLMSSFNVLEDGDPVHRYKLQGDSTPQKSSYPAWQEAEREHNTSSILTTLREPDGNPPISSSPATPTGGVTSSTSGQQPVVYTSLQTTNPQWEKQSDQQNGNDPGHSENMSGSAVTLHELTSPSSERNTGGNSGRSPTTPVAESQEDTLTRAVKETFSVAHFCCSFCNDKFRVPERLAEHVKRVHSGSIEYTCFTCGKKFYNSFDLREHVASHANDPIKCSLCDLTLASSKELRTHHKKAHPMAAMACPLCDKIFTTSTARFKHMSAEHHNDNRVILCDLCGDPFVDRAAYEEHYRSHPKNGNTVSGTTGARLSEPKQPEQAPAAVVIWKCDKCGHVSSDDRHLAAHKATAHPGEAPPRLPDQRIPSLEPLTKQTKSTMPAVGSSRYELLRLLLARRMAIAPSAERPLETAASIMSPANGKERTGGEGRLNQSNMTPPAGATQQLSGGAQQKQVGLPAAKSPGILSAAAVQHVADELNMLEQRMEANKKNGANRPLISLTADEMMEGESTIGINLALKKNTSPDVAFQEIHKQKTLVNMLQGTVASIIEREVKHPRPQNRISWPISFQDGNSTETPTISTTVSTAPTSSPNVASSKYHMTSNFGQHTAKAVENNNDVYDNRNLAPGQSSISASIYPGDSLVSLTTMTSPNHPSYLTCNTTLSTSSSAISTLPSTEAYGMSTQTIKQHTMDSLPQPRSAWDHHIEPLLKLFQNVSSPVNKETENSMFDERKTSEGNSPYLINNFPQPNSSRDDILDLSSTSQTLYNIENYSASTTTESASNTQSPGRSNSGTLPSFGDIAWTRNMNRNDTNEQLKSTLNMTVPVERDYEFPAYSSSQNSLCHMSGGQVHYAESKNSSDQVFFESNQSDAVYSVSQSDPLPPPMPMDCAPQEHTEGYLAGNFVTSSELLHVEQAVGQVDQTLHVQNSNQTYLLPQGQSHLAESQIRSPPPIQTTAMTSPSLSQAQIIQESHLVLSPPPGCDSLDPFSRTMQPQEQLSGQIREPYNASLEHASVSPEQPQQQQFHQLQNRNHNHNHHQQVQISEPHSHRAQENVPSTQHLEQYENAELVRQHQQSLQSQQQHQPIIQKQQQQMDPYSRAHGQLEHQRLHERGQQVRYSEPQHLHEHQPTDHQSAPQYQVQDSGNLRQYQHTDSNGGHIRGSGVGSELPSEVKVPCCKQGSPPPAMRYLGLRKMILSKRMMADAPLVVRHKLLATMLKDGSSSVQSRADNMSQLANNPKDQLKGHGHPGSEGRFVGSAANPTLSNRGNISEHSGEEQRTGNNGRNQAGSNSEAHVRMEQQWERQSALQLETLTIDNQLLDQMMQTNIPTHKEHFETTISNRKDLHCENKGSPQTLSQSAQDSVPWTVAEVNKSNSYNNERPPSGLKMKRKQKLIGPASRKRSAVILIQRAEDVFYMSNGTVNVSAERKKLSCDSLGCRLARKLQRLRGRPPKNGQMSMRKGSYKKGKYQCPICKKVYAWKNYLRIHIAKHSGNTSGNSIT